MGKRWGAFHGGDKKYVTLSHVATRHIAQGRQAVTDSFVLSLTDGGTRSDMPPRKAPCAESCVRETLRNDDTFRRKILDTPS